MANLLEQYREAFPEFRDASDAQLTDVLFEKYGGKDTNKDDFALSIRGRGPRMGPFAAGIEGLKSSGEMLVARTAQAVGAEETAQKYLKRSQERDEDTDARYQPETKSFDDVDGAYKFGRYLYERFGESAPQMLLMAAGGVGGLAARGALGAVGFAAARGLSLDAAMSVGSTVAGAGAYTGSNLQRQIQEGTKFEDTSLAGAGAAALGQSALDTLSLRTIFKGISAPVAGSRTAAAVQRAVESGATEALTETGQQALEILQANPGKLYSFSPEVQKELKDAAIAGGLLGAAMGGAGGALTYRKGQAAKEGRDKTPSADLKGPGSEEEGTTAEGDTTTEGETGTEEGTDTTGEGEQLPPADKPLTTGEAPDLELPPVQTPEDIEVPAPKPLPTDQGPVETAPAAEPVETQPIAVEPVEAPAPVAGEPVGAPAPLDVPPVTTEPVAVEPGTTPAAPAPSAPAPVAVEPIPAPKPVDVKPTPAPKPTVNGPLPIDQTPVTGTEAARLPTQGTMGAVPFKKSESVRATTATNANGTGPNNNRDNIILDTQAPGQNASRINVRRDHFKLLNEKLPGFMEPLREIGARLYPGADINLVVQNRPNYQSGSIGGLTVDQDGRTKFRIRINVGAAPHMFPNGNEKTWQVERLHTLFHELSHPIEYTYLANAPKETLQAVIQQYVRERNPMALERAAVFEAFKGLNPADPKFFDNLAGYLHLTPQQLREYQQSKKKILPVAVRKPFREGATSIRSDYNRSFTEWVAEKGAQWLSKEMQNIVPKTAFQRFQKEILDKFRELFDQVTKALGLKPRKGAFEKFMSEVYGKTVNVPAATAKRIISRDVINYDSDGYRFTQGGGPSKVNPEPEVTELASQAVPASVQAAQGKLAETYTPPEKMGFKGFIKAVKEAYQTGSGKDLGDKITRAASDRYIDLKRLDERFVDFLKRSGRAVQAAYDNRYALVANLSSYAGILQRENVLGMLETVLKYGGVPIIKKFSKVADPLDGVLTISRDGNEKGLTFLKDLIEKDKLDAFKYYSMAKRILGRYSTLKSPITEAEAKEIVAHYGSDPDVVAAYKAYQDFNKAMMKMAVDAGVISQDIADEFLKHNDYYPFYREMDDTGKYTGPLFTQGVLTRTKIQAAIGGTEKLDADPVEVIMKNAQFWMHSAAKNLASKKIITMMTELGEATEINHPSKLKPGEGLGVVRVDGKEKMYALNNPDIVAALETTGAHQLPNWTKVPGSFTRFYRELVTRSPDFILKNMIRDPLSAMVTSGVSINPVKAMGNLVRAMTDKNNKNLLAIQNYGIVGGFRTIPGTEDASKFLNTDFKPTSNGIYVVPNGNVLTGIISKAWNKLGEVAEASDAATRMEIYEKVLKETGNEAEAAFRAQEYMNFRKQGNSSIIRYMSIMVPFINGRIQGLDVTARAFHPKNLPFTMLKGGYLTAVAMGLQAMFGDDDDYKQLPDYVRHGSLPIPLKALGLGDSGFLAIPKPFEIGFVFQTVPEVIAQAAMGNTEHREIKRVAWEQMKSTFGLSLSPQFASPIVELIRNQSNLTGLPIVTDAMKNLPAELQYSAATSDIVKNLAGAAGLSPVQVEALIKGYGGQIGTMILGVVDGLYRSATGTGVDKDWTQYPTISTFLKTQQNTNPKGAADVYRLSAEIQGITTAINTYVAQGMADKAMELMQDNRDLLAMKQAVSGLRTQLNTLSRNERMLVNNPNVPQDTKESQVQMLRDARRVIGNAMTGLIDKTGK